MARKVYPPITTFKDFFKVLRIAHERREYEFEFKQTMFPIWDDNGWAYGNAVYYRAPDTSLWSPASVVDRAFYSPDDKTWSPESMSWQHMGMPKEKYLELVLVFHERTGFLMPLRERLCEAVGLEEVPICERSSYHVVENMDKRRR